MEDKDVHSSTDCALYVCTDVSLCCSGMGASVKSWRLSSPKSMSTSTSSGLCTASPLMFVLIGRLGGPPIIDASTCTGSGTLGGIPPVGRRRGGAPFGPRAVDGKLTFEAPGETSDKDDVRGCRPGLMGSGPGAG